MNRNQAALAIRPVNRGGEGCLPLDAMRRPRDTPIWKLDGSLKCSLAGRAARHQLDQIRFLIRLASGRGEPGFSLLGPLASQLGSPGISIHRAGQAD